MTDMLQKGQEWLASKLTQHASRQVAYRRGELGTTLQATIGKSIYDQDDGEGIVTRSQVRDFHRTPFAARIDYWNQKPRAIAVDHRAFERQQLTA